MTLQELIVKHVETFEAWPAPGTDYSERGTLRFSFSLDGNIRGDWSCGSGVPLHAYLKEPFRVNNYYGAPLEQACKPQRITLYVDAARVAIRKAYCPKAIDIASSLLIESASADPYQDWLDWAEEFGGLQDAKADKLRELQTCFALIKQRTAQLRRLFGTDYDAAVELAQQM